jgi:translation initiation factor IF-3
VIDETGKNLGIVEISKALEIAKEKGLDLIEIAPTANPPIAKIMDYGKFQYQEKKKSREKKSSAGEMKNIRFNIGTSRHDLKVKAKKISEFLKEGCQVKIEMILRGQAKFLNRNFLKERIERILPFITENYKIAQELKNEVRGMSLIIEKEK